MNDLVRGGCSEEATVLGILRVADEIYFGNPNSVIVIQGILPWSKYSDGSLEHHKHGFHPLQYGAAKEYGVKDAKQYFTLWPSIQHINAELEKFCSLHNHLIYFDVSALFLGTVGNQIYRKKEQHIITTLLSEGKTLTFNGYTVLGVAIQQELERIIYDGNEKNDLEGQT